jgi:superfamily II DNA or RNA helicase
MIKVTVTNRVAQFHHPYPKEELMEFFSFRPENFRFMPSYRMGQWDGFIRLLKRDKVPVGLFLAKQREIEAKIGKMQIIERIVPLEFSEVQTNGARPYQLACVVAMRQAARKGGGIVLKATGSGKTFTVGLFLKQFQGDACFVVDELLLMAQAKQELEQVLGEEVGEVGKGLFLPKRVTVATIQTLSLHRTRPTFLDWFAQIDMLIIDELHVSMSKRAFTIIDVAHPLAVFGLTATLELNKKHIATKAYAIAGPVCYTYPLEQGQKEGYLSEGVCLSIECPTTGRNFNQYAEDYKEHILYNEHRNELIEQVVNAGDSIGCKTIVLVSRVAHLKLLSERFQHIKHKVIYGAVSGEDRMEWKDEFERGEYNLIITNRVFSKGTNIKSVNLMIDAAAQKSKNDAVQKFGRGARKIKGKDGLIYIDIGDKGNRFELAAKRRRNALRKVGISVMKLKLFSDIDFSKILREQYEKLAEK